MTGSRLYPSHIPLSTLQRAALTLGASIGAFLRPARADLVATVGELTGHQAFRNLHARMSACESGRAILTERPRITNAMLERCAALPAGTFGSAYADFMRSRHFEADARPPVRFVDDAELAYVATRIREVHDLWHVLFDCHTNVFGETALKALEFVQTGIPMTGAAVIAGQRRMSASQRELLAAQFLPWAARAGSQCADLVTLYYERHLTDDLDDVRERWRIITAPQLVGSVLVTRAPNDAVAAAQPPPIVVAT